MRHDELLEHVARARRLVESWPPWKQNILEQSSRPSVYAPRAPVAPYLYRVDFYVGGCIVGSAEVRAWSRKEAWIESWSTEEFGRVRARHSENQIMFDATRLERIEEI